MFKVKPLEWNKLGFAHTVLGISFRVSSSDAGFILERFQHEIVATSQHNSEQEAICAANTWLAESISYMIEDA